jgi:hypothetical protein
MATSPANVHFAHRSRRFTIRTVSHTQTAANPTPNIDRHMSMHEF